MYKSCAAPQAESGGSDSLLQDWDSSLILEEAGRLAILKLEG